MLGAVAVAPPPGTQRGGRRRAGELRRCARAAGRARARRRPGPGRPGLAPGQRARSLPAGRHRAAAQPAGGRPARVPRARAVRGRPGRAGRPGGRGGPGMAGRRRRRRDVSRRARRPVRRDHPGGQAPCGRGSGRRDPPAGSGQGDRPRAGPRPPRAPGGPARRSTRTCRPSPRTTPPPEGLGPLELPSTDLGPHLSYAFQWWVFAAGALVGAVILLRRDEPAPDCGRRPPPPRPAPRRRGRAEEEEDALLDAQEAARASVPAAPGTRAGTRPAGPASPDRG